MIAMLVNLKTSGKSVQQTENKNLRTNVINLSPKGKIVCRHIFFSFAIPFFSLKSFRNWMRPWHIVKCNLLYMKSIDLKVYYHKIISM